MFGRTRRSVLVEIEKENPELASILTSVNELLRMARGKLTYMQNVLEYYNRRGYIEHDKAKEYLQANVEALARIEELLKKEKVIEAGEKTMKPVFAGEIESMDEARNILKQLKHILEKETALLKITSNWKVSDVERVRINSKIIVAMVKFVQKEAELLGIESQKIQAISKGLEILRERIANSRKMPIVKAKYYYGSYFIFNVGDKVRPSRQRTEKGKVIEVEKIFEEVRKREFPHRPSRINAVYCTTDPLAAASYGIVYAVKVEWIPFKTDQEILTDAREAWREHGNRQEIEVLARDYWEEGSRFSAIPETIVDAATIVGLADYFRQDDRVEVIVNVIKDKDGMPVPKGSKGVIESYNAWIDELPLHVRLDNGELASLPASTIRKIK